MADNGGKGVARLYYDPLSEPCRAAHLFLAANGIDFDLEDADPTKGVPGPGPFRGLPVLEHAGRIIRSPSAILRYLCREYKVPDRWYPVDSLLRARVDEYLEWHQQEVSAKASLYIYHSARADGERMAACLPKLREACDLVESAWLADSQFIATQELSLADLVLAVQLEQLALTDFDPEDGRPALSAWKRRVRQELNPLYDVVHLYLNQFSMAKHRSEPLNFDE